MWRGKKDGESIHDNLLQLHFVLEPCMTESVAEKSAADSRRHLDISHLLSRLPLFQELSAEQIDELVVDCRERRPSGRSWP